MLNEPWTYIVLLGMVILVLSFLAPRGKQDESSAGTPLMLKEMEETMDHFVAEIEEENQALLQKVAEMKQEHDHIVQKLGERVDTLEKLYREQSSELKRFALYRLENYDKHPDGKPAPTDIPVNSELAEESAASLEQTGVKARYPELFQLYHEGKSVEYISKKMGINKGEVLLIIQLAKQEEG